MTYGRYPYGGVAYAASDVDELPADTETTLAVEVSFTTGPLEEPVWVDISHDVRSWDTQRGRSRELERFQPGRATVVLSNLSRQYDSLHTANIKPMKRIRIRETFSGVTYPVFDGFVDRWQLDYPDVNKDATATVTATDALKVLARTDLPISVYHDTVLADLPSIYWRLDEAKNAEDDGSLLALNAGTLGSTADGTYVGPPELGGEPLVVKDPGSSMTVTNSIQTPSTGLMGVTLNPFDILGGGSLTARGFVFEAWVLPTHQDLNNIWVFSDTDGDAQIFYQTATTFRFSVTTGGSTFTVDSAAAPSHKRYHLVAKFTPGSALELWVNGTRTTGGTPTGAIADAGNDLFVGHRGVFADSNWAGQISHVAVYLDAAATAVGQGWVDRHYAAGTTPWQGDLPGVRLGRVLDEAAWPAAWREIDAGITTFQSADLGAGPALEHAQKVADTEYASLLFVDRTGNVRFVDRTAVLAREPYPAVFGDDAGEVGYATLVPDDGDQEIRNRAKVSRLGGVVKTAEDAASIADFAPFEYVAEGLLSDSETESAAHAAFVVSQYAEQRRRVTSLTLTTPIPGDEDIAYPAMLGPELGDAITVRHEPPGGGTEFEQVCAVEGIEHAGSPKERTTRLILSPEFPIRALEDEDVSTLGYAEITSNFGPITSLADITGLSSVVTVGSSRRVRVSAMALFNSTVAGDDVRLHIREGSTTLEIIIHTLSTATGFETYSGSVVLTPSAGSHTYKLSAERSAGSGIVNLTATSTIPAFILVEDIGPA